MEEEGVSTDQPRVGAAGFTLLMRRLHSTINRLTLTSALPELCRCPPDCELYPRSKLPAAAPTGS